MFPLRWDFPFRKKDGSLSTISDEIEGGGGGGYTLPTASPSTKGGIKVGENLTMTGEFLDADEQLPTYTSAEEGKVLSVDAEGELEWTTPGGGSSTKLYYKTFSSADMYNKSEVVSGKLYFISIKNIDVQGYTPISVIVKDKYTGYNILGGIYTDGASHSVKILTSYTGTSTDFIQGTKVIYVKNEDLASLDN